MSKDDANEQAAGISDLQQNFSKQQKKISALKELVLKSEVAHGKSTSSAQEKVKNIAQRLTQLKSLARSRQNLDSSKQSTSAEAEAKEQQHESLSTVSQMDFSGVPPAFTNVSTPNPSPTPTPAKPKTSELSASMASTSTTGNEKFLLLRQQMEENKVRMAQRASSKLHLEQMVSQLKEKFDSTQQCLEDTTELGKSMGDLSAVSAYSAAPRGRHKSATDLSLQPFSLEKERIKFLENRCRLLEKQLEKERQTNNNVRENPLSESSVSPSSEKRIKELEAKVVEIEGALTDREIEIESRKTIESKLEEEITSLRSTVVAQDAMIDDLRKKSSISNPNNVENIESDDVKAENERLRIEISEALKRVTELEKLNEELETTRCDLMFKNDKLQDQLSDLKSELTMTTTENKRLEEKCLQLEKKYTHSAKAKETATEQKKSLDTDSQVKAEMAKQIQELHDEIQIIRTENGQLREQLAKSERLEVSDASIAERIAALESTIESQRDDLKNRAETIRNQEEELMEKTIELNVLNANFKVLEEKLQASTKSKPLFSSGGASNVDVATLRSENQQLKQKLDESNKAMIKLKLQSKQIEKQMKKLEKSSNLHAEIVKLEKANDELQQKIIELEDEKGQWQLTQVEDNKAAGDSKPKPERDAELAEKNKLQADTISLLEQQKYDQSQIIESLQQELRALQEKLNSEELSAAATRVESDWSEIQLEDQLREQEQEVKALNEQLRIKENELEEMSARMLETQTQKEATDKKLEHYINENMELLDKVEKLSKSSSSAESIEIVERLTQQERAEIDEFNKRLDQEHISDHATSLVNELTQTEMGPELSESLVKLREECSELLNKIELFTSERREVMEKMEHLTAENNELIEKIEELTQQKEMMETNGLLAENEKSKLESKLQEITKEKEVLALQVAESSAQKMQLSQDLTSLQKSSEVVAALDGKEETTLLDKCENSLTKLNSELEAYRKANDKNAKFNASKKLAKEAKNAYMQLRELLLKVKEASNAVETVTVVETVVAVTAPNGKALAEYEQLTAQNRELKAMVEELRRELEEANETVEVPPAHVPAIDVSDSTQSQDKLRDAHERLNEYEKQCIHLQSVVEDFRMQLQESRLAGEEKSTEITQLNDELNNLRKLSDDFDRLLNDKEMAFEKQIEHLTRLRKELEAKCETYESEIEILQTLVKEQKQQLIEAYQESEHENNLKLLDLQQRDEEISRLNAELKAMKSASTKLGQEFAENLQLECDKLRDSLRVNKSLVAEQVNELANKQETIDTLNEQITELYKTLEENGSNIIQKEDEIANLNELLDANRMELQKLHKDNDAQKAVVDKLLNELHSHQSSSLQVPQLESELQRMSQINKELEHANAELDKHNKEQLEKLKKYAANLKKRTLRCQELEVKVVEMEKGSTDGNAVTLNELELLKECNSQLNEEINNLKQKLEYAESNLPAIQEALQTKTMELLECMERNAKLEDDINQLKENLEQKIQESVQLQNALAASQDKPSPYFDAVMDKDKELAEKIESLQRTETVLAHLQHEVLQLSEKLVEARQAKLEFEEDIRKKDTAIEQLKEEIELLKLNQNETYTLKEKLHAQEAQMLEINEQLKTKSLKFEKSKAVIKERNNQIQRLQVQLKELQDKLSEKPEEDVIQPVIVQSNLSMSAPKQPSVSEADHNALKEAYDKLKDEYTNEKSNFQQTIARLETLHDGIQAKLQEDMSYIESLEQENGKFKDKICKLEECVAMFEERRASMERRANFLDAQMQSRADEFVKTEDELIYRLNMLSEHDEVIAQRLLESQEEKECLQEQINTLQAKVKEQQANYAKLEKTYQTYQDNVSSNLEAENITLREQLKALEADTQRMRASYDAKLTAKTTEIDELESELSDQMQILNAEKRSLSEDLERARDECTEHKDEIVRLKESLNAMEQAKNELERDSTWLRMQNDNALQDQYEMQELRMQTIQDRTELDNLRHQIESLVSNHEIELQGLRTQISELDDLRMQVGQNQTDDQVFIESENKRLTDLLAEKEALIENYQRQNLQLQMAASNASQAQVALQPDPLALAFGLPPESTVNTPTSNDDIRRLERELLEKTEVANRLQRELAALQSEHNNILEGNNAIQQRIVSENYGLGSLNNWSMPSQPVENILPAPPMFFGSDSMESSPFDEIIQVRSVNNLQSPAGRSQATPQDPFTSGGHQTIEDLQRNVSDLEKHAHELENKLAQRNQRENESEERLREAHKRVQEAEVQAKIREQELQIAQQEMQRLQQEISFKTATETDQQRSVDQLNSRLQDVQQQLAARDARIEELEIKLQSTAAEGQRTSDRDDLLRQLNDLQKQLQDTLPLLQAKDREIDELRQAVEREKHLQAITANIDSQILPPPVAMEVDTAKVDKSRPSLELFFGSASASDFDIVIPEVSKDPVVEEIIVPKKAYVCQPSDESAPLALELGDDWGDTWGSSEAAAEEAYIAKNSSAPLNGRQSLVPREQQLELQLQEQSERLAELQSALEQSEQSKQELQVKSTKLMKKLKEYKTKIDELNTTNSRAFIKSSSVESNNIFSDLDAAIEEELKSQIKVLECKLEEQQKNQDEQATEKEKLLKRIDVLTAGQDRMMEMKDRQDMDVQMYQARIRELQTKLQQLENWDTEKVEKENQEVPTDDDKKVYEHKIAELISENRELKVDQQELQALLDEEKLKVEQAEETIRSLKLQITTLDNAAASTESAEKFKYNELKIEFQKLQENLNNLTDENERLQSLESEYNVSLQQHQCQERQLLADLSASEQKLKDLQVEIQNLQTTLNERDETCNDLQSQLLELRTRYDEQVQAVEELRPLLENKEFLERKVNELKLEFDNIQAGSPQSTELEAILSSNDKLNALIAEKDAEITHLKQKVKDLMLEDQTQKLVMEILAKNTEIHMLKVQVKNLEEDKQELEHNLSLQITNELQAGKDDANARNEELCSRVNELESQVGKLEEEKYNMEEELKVLNNHVMATLEQEEKLKAAVLELDAKNIEITEMRKSLDLLKINLDENKNGPNSNQPDVDFVALNAKWEAIVEQRCGEIAQLWKNHLEQRENEFKMMEANLREEIEELRAANSGELIEGRKQTQLSAESTSSVVESSSGSVSTSGESSKDSTPLRARVIQEESEGDTNGIIEKMQTALENQEMEIVTLKEQLAIRSAEYARLAAQYDPFKLQTTLSHSGMTTVANPANPELRNDSSLVPKAELDLALYVLHQRDLRCDELTVEIVSLLKERDTLQLKLSNTLRQMETIRTQTSSMEMPATSTDAASSSSDSPKKSSPAVSATSDSTNELNLKLSQLQTVDHSKDKVIKEDREQRIRQMERIQQDVSKMPSAAVSELMGTDLSRINQSPSSVLLNWLWGNKMSQHPDGGPPLN